MIYLFDGLHDKKIADISKTIFPLMPIERQQKVMRYRQKIDRDLSVLAYGLLMYGLRNEYNIYDLPLFTYGKCGKPYLSNYPNIYFNISHCKVGVVCAVSDKEVGVDMQDITPYDTDVACRVCTAEEMHILSQSKSPQNDFCKLWTIKESYIKQKGGSILFPLRTLSSNIVVKKSEDEFICQPEKSHPAKHAGWEAPAEQI